MGFGFYSDPALTTMLSSSLVFMQDMVAQVPQDRMIWLGDPDPSNTLFESSDPGVADIYVFVQDSNSDSGMPAEAVKISGSASGLDDAVAGEPLLLGPSISGGVENAIEIHIRVDWSGTSGVFNDVSLTTNDVISTGETTGGGGGGGGGDLPT